MAFEGAGQAVGIEIWRLEKMVPVRWTRPGEFYSGDCYIVLNTIKPASRYDLFYWLGTDSTVDERGGIAYSAVELDQTLGDAPVQYREVQGHESGQFVALWKNCGGLRYLEGGIDSAFHHVTPEEYKPRLLHVKGTRAVRVHEVKRSAASLNNGDAFVLDAGLTLYLWHGEDVNRYEKIKASEVIRFIAQERKIRVEVVIMAEANPDQWSEFWSLLGGEQPIEAGDVESDNMHDVSQASEVLLLTLKGDEYVASTQTAPFYRRDFDSTSIYLLDTGSIEGIFVWVGNESPVSDRKISVKLAEDYLRQKKRPLSTPICRMHEGCESAVFKTHVSQFNTPQPKKWSSNVACMRASEVDISAMHTERAQATQISLRNREEETINVWRVENFALVDVPVEQHGEFYDGDSYVVEYIYRPKHKRGEEVLYFWQGKSSTVDEKGASAMFIAQMDEERHQGRAVQVRVPMGKEPLAFCLLFRGKMIIHNGGAVSGFKSAPVSDDHDAGTVRLYHIRGESPMECQAIQVFPVAASLHSNDVFVLVNKESSILWRGHGASEEEEIFVGKEMCNRLCIGPLQVIKENEETDEFWQLLGGKDEYTSNPSMYDPSFRPRLFQVSNATGALRCEEIFNFVQQDLFEEDVMLLDVKTAVFVWIGRLAHRDEIKEAPRIADQYLAASDSQGGSVVIVHQGNEPLVFTSHFNWDESPEVVKRKCSINTVPTPAKANIHPLETLQQSLPSGVVSSEKEKFLSDDDFQRAFAMSPTEFTKLPPWKKMDMKKKALLF